MSAELPVEVQLSGPRSYRGRLRVPGDKSISHRAVLFAALADGQCRLSGLADGDDVRRSQAVIEALGVKVRAPGPGSRVVKGNGFEGLAEPEAILDCGNSGTSIRLLAGLLAGRPYHSVLTGDASIVRRPMGRVVDPLRAMGARIDGRAGGTLAPLSIRGGDLNGQRFDLKVASAQVKTALILAGLQADGVTEITEPALSRDHTERLAAALGIALTRFAVRSSAEGPPGDAAAASRRPASDATPAAFAGPAWEAAGNGRPGVRVEPGPVTAFDLEVPGDPSAAAFFVVGACITPGSDLVIEDVCLNPTRIGFVHVLQRMGAEIEVEITGERGGEPVGNLHVVSSALTATKMAGAEIPSIIDEIPALAVAAAFASGVTEITDAAELRVKESDRIGTVQQELSQLGVAVEARPDGLVITGGRPRAGLLKSHGDHRIAMAAAVAATACDGTSTVRGWRAIASSYPRFGEHLAGVLGA